MTEAQSERAREVNFDGLVGPTHNYAGLSVGNLASTTNAGDVSNPRQAALQGLAKMRRLIQLGIPQGVLPPQQRPDPTAMQALGFASSATVADVSRRRNGLVPVVMSAASMWAANAATVSPSSDTADGRVHLTPANLSSTAHRSFEAVQTGAILGAIFADETRFRVHQPVPATAAFSDEGAANHGRITSDHGSTGLQVFVYGREADRPLTDPSSGFPRRQTRLAGQMISASHGLGEHGVFFASQAAEAINAGAFHNDVVSVMNEHVLFTHAQAFEKPADTYAALTEAASRLGVDLDIVEVSAGDVSLTDAVASYLFNSQLVTLPDNSMTLIAPAEIEETPSVKAYLDSAVADPGNPIGSLHVMDLRESMRNGGGPACLRLRVVLTQQERAAVTGKAILDEATIDDLEAWVQRHYRDELRPADLVDPAFAAETLTALDELTGVLDLGPIYAFQR